MCEAKKSVFFIPLRFLQTKLNLLLEMPCFFCMLYITLITNDIEDHLMWFG